MNAMSIWEHIIIWSIVIIWNGFLIYKMYKDKKDGE